MQAETLSPSDVILGENIDMSVFGRSLNSSRRLVLSVALSGLLPIMTVPLASAQNGQTHSSSASAVLQISVFVLPTVYLSAPNIPVASRKTAVAYNVPVSRESGDLSVEVRKVDMVRRGVRVRADLKTTTLVSR
jgi:hypothetical protein